MFADLVALMAVVSIHSFTHETDGQTHHAVKYGGHCYCISFIEDTVIEHDILLRRKLIMFSC